MRNITFIYKKKDTNETGGPDSEVACPVFPY